MADSMRNLLGRWGAVRAALFAGTGLLLVLALLGVSRWASAPEWVPLVQGQPLEAVGNMSAKLDEAGLMYRLDHGGATLMVQEGDAAKARVLLAQAGLTAVGDPGFELFDRPSWGMTDFTQRINYRRALEGELERSIGEMRGVARARVHLALNERSSLRRATENEAASVVLGLEPGARSGEELVEAISSLVASSVDGLSSDKVTILDDTGRLLNAAAEAGTSSSARKRELTARRDVEGYLESRAEELVAQVVGSGNVRVRVAAELSMDRVDRTVQKVDPDQQVTTHEEKTEVVAAPGQTNGTSATTTSYEASRQVETISNPGGDIRRLTVAVVLNADAAQKGGTSTAGVEALVANAVGINRARGDSISVVSIPFAPAIPADAPVEPKRDVGGWVELLRRPVLGVLGLILTFVLGLNVLRLVRAALRPQPVPATVNAIASGYAAALPPVHEPRHALPVVEDAPLVQSSLNPEMAARVLRAWARES